MTVRKDETWHSYENFQYIKFIYSEMWFNFPHFIFFTESKIICVSMSKNPSKLRILGFSFLLHLTRQKGPSSSCTHPHNMLVFLLNHVYGSNNHSGCAKICNGAHICHIGQIFPLQDFCRGFWSCTWSMSHKIVS